MKPATIQRLGGAALVAGAALFAVYSVFFPALLPISEAGRDFTVIILNPAWGPLALTAFAGILLMMAGFAAVYARLGVDGGWTGLGGFLLLEVAYLLQAAKVTWEFCLYRAIARYAPAAPLLRDRSLLRDGDVVAFRAVASATIFVGILLFCFALMRSKAFPKPGGALVLAGAVLYGLGPVLGIWAMVAGIFILASGCFVLGVTLLRVRDA
jgi:hypothetical protein